MWVLLLPIVFICPLAYQTNDDATLAQILQGDRGLETPPDARALYVHSAIGSVVSAASRRWPAIAWYGVFSVVLCAGAFAVMGASLPGGAPATRHGLSTALAFVAAFALLPLVLLQFTVLAGLLAIAGMLPWLRWISFREPSPRRVWALAIACLVVGLMVRFQMAVTVMASILPVIGLALFEDRDWGRLVRCSLYVLALGVVGLGLNALDRRAYQASPAYARLLDFNLVRSAYADRVDYTHLIPVHTKEGAGDGSVATAGLLSPNDAVMFRASMVIDSGPFALERLRGASGAEDRAGITAPAAAVEARAVDPPVSSTRLKLDGLLAGRNPRHTRLTLYLLVVFGAATALVAGAAALGDWRSVRHASVAGMTAIGSCALSAVILDRAVFRVMLPAAYVFLVTAIARFPWGRVRVVGDRPAWRALALRAAIGVFVLSGLTGLLLGLTQIRQNHVNRSLYENMMRDVHALAGPERAVIGWSVAVPIEFQSPFAHGDRPGLTLFRVSPLASHPTVLARLRARFGDDVYAGLPRPDVIHLVDNPGQIERLKTFYAEHYGWRIAAISLGAFDNGEGKTTAWTLARLDAR